MKTTEPAVSLEAIESSAGSAGPYDAELKAAGQLTSPTWELELFLSGAFVFASFQLPGLVEQLFSHLEPHATETTSGVLFVAALYAKAIAFTLVATFLIHLVTRAYWVALMGLHSVFPRGIRWDKMKVGPIAKEVYQSRGRDINGAIGRLDNFCSIVFSAGLLIVLVFVYSTLLLGAMAGTAYLLAQWLTHGQNMRYFFYGLMAVFVILPAGASLIDRRWGDRIPAGSPAYRVIKSLLRFGVTVSLVQITGPMTWTLATNVGRRRLIAFLMIAVAGLITVSAADRLAQSDRLSVNGYDYFGRSRGHEMNYRFYENQREQGKLYPRTPSIQSDIIGDSYVKLFIPYNPRRDNAALARACPGMRPLQDRGLQIGADSYLADSLVVPVLQCIARLRAVTLDGTPRPELQFAFYENPATGLKGVLTYIPAESLSRGRHTIGLLAIPPAELATDSAALARGGWKEPTTIPFWR